MPPSNYSHLGQTTLAMKVAVSLACKELGIGAADLSKRDAVAILMAPLANRGSASIDRLKTFAISQYRMSK